MSKLYIMRGVPGSGKSTMARAIAQKEFEAGRAGVVIASTDDYFINDKGEYVFKMKELVKAHRWNRRRARRAIAIMAAPSLYPRTIEIVIIDNTNMTHKETMAYKKSALRRDIEVEEIIMDKEILLQRGGPEWEAYIDMCAERNTHGVPRETIERMARKFQE